MLDQLQNRLAVFFQEKSANDVARQVRDMSVDKVCTVVAGRVQGMPLSEMRGYVRARAALVVRRYAATAVRTAGLHASLEEQVRRNATEQLVPVVIRRLESERVRSLTARAA